MGLAALISTASVVKVGTARRSKGAQAMAANSGMSYKVAVDRHNTTANALAGVLLQTVVDECNINTAIPSKLIVPSVPVHRVKGLRVIATSMWSCIAAVAAAP